MKTASCNVLLTVAVLCCCCCVTVSGFRHHAQAEKVQVGLFFESVCPPSLIMLVRDLYPAYTKGLDQIMELSLVPYGKATEIEDNPGHWLFRCEHGDLECEGNIIETCTIKLYPHVSDHLPFFVCMNESYFNPPAYAPECAKRTGLDWQKISTCAQGADGNKFEHEMAVLTEQLKPALSWTPWITINGQHLNSDVDTNPVNAICAAYTGDKTQISPCMKVPVAVYYESYCPHCKELIATNLFPAMAHGGLNEIMDLTLVPYGNTKQIPSNGTGQFTYTCEHGDDECTVNVYEQCVLGILEDSYTFNFIYCLENATDPLSSAQSCAQSTCTPLQAVTQCAEDAGSDTQEEYANMTNSLVPPLKSVPWVTINGAHPGASCDTDAVTCICQAYKGVLKVAACSHVHALAGAGAGDLEFVQPAENAHTSEKKSSTSAPVQKMKMKTDRAPRHPRQQPQQQKKKGRRL